MFRSAHESPAAPAPASRWRSRRWLQTALVAAALWLATVALYWPSLRHDFVTAYDDDAYVAANAHVKAGLSMENLRWALVTPVCSNWHPVTILSHMLDCQLYGLQPWGHHLTSLLFHALDTVLVFLLLRQITGAPWRSALVAALFGWHPMHVESVAWVAERKDVLSAFFGFLTLILYARYARQTVPAAGPLAFALSPWYWLAWLAYALGLMSKPMLVTWPCLLLLLDYWPLNRFSARRWWSLVVEKTPFFAAAAAAGVTTFLVQRQVGATKTLEYLPLAMRCENAAIAYCRYLFKLFCPTHLAAFYPLPPSWPWGWALLAAAALPALTLVAWTQRKRAPFLLVGWLWFIGTLVPVIGLVQVGLQSMADRYAYIPSVGVFVLAVWGMSELLARWPHRTAILAVSGSAALVACGALTRQQLGYWQNGETLFRHTLAVTPDNDYARNLLGIALLDTSQTNAAIHEFQTALQLNPTCIAAMESLGILRADQGDTDAAIGFYRQALSLKPDDANLHYHLGNVLVRKGDLDDATTEFQTAIRYAPNLPEAHNNLGDLLAARGHSPEAITQFNEAVRLNPYYADAHYNLGNALLKTGQWEAAITQFQAAIRCSPDLARAHYALAAALARQNRTEAAIREFQATIRLKPDYPPAHEKLGILLGDNGRLDDAIAEFQTAIRLKPDYPEASNNLARALALKERLSNH